MPTITTKDGIEIFHKDWGTGQPIVFSHGWPLSADVLPPIPRLSLPALLGDARAKLRLQISITGLHSGPYSSGTSSHRAVQGHGRSW